MPSHSLDRCLLESQAGKTGGGREEREEKGEKIVRGLLLAQSVLGKCFSKHRRGGCKVARGTQTLPNLQCLSQQMQPLPSLLGGSGFFWCFFAGFLLARVLRPSGGCHLPARHPDRRFCQRHGLRHCEGDTLQGSGCLLCFSIFFFSFCIDFICRTTSKNIYIY